MGSVCSAGRRAEISRTAQLPVMATEMAGQVGATHMTEMTAEEAYQMGNNYWDGIGGVEQSDEEAARCFARAAEAGHAGGRRNLVQCWYEGRGRAKDMEKAVEL